MKINDVGTSDYTSLKQQHFSTILKTHLRIFANIIHKHTWAHTTYLYIDMNAGPGKYQNIVGSPLIFIEAANKVNINYMVTLIEKDKKNYHSLCQNLPTISKNSQVLINKDHHEALQQYHRFEPSRYGLIYNDPSGNLPSFDDLSLFADYYKRVDILINCPCTTVKRVQKAFPGRDSLIDLISQINKKYWLVREPYYKHQWTFLVGTNWSDFPQFENIGLYSTQTPKGSDILTRLSETRLDAHKKLEEKIIEMSSKSLSNQKIAKALEVSTNKVTRVIGKK